jgi:hypothetical protein
MAVLTLTMLMITLVCTIGPTLKYDMLDISGPGVPLIRRDQ